MADENKALTVLDKDALMEKVLLEGDLTQLKPHERLEYYSRVCNSLGLNPTTRPFDYIKLNGKLTLYAKKDATEQLRKINGVSITALDKEWKDNLGLYIVTAHATDKMGRSDAATGAVTVKGLVGDNLANAVMKAETKSKRRVTLSICGLGFVDESELSSIHDAHPVVVTESGDIIEGVVTKTPDTTASSKVEEVSGDSATSDGASPSDLALLTIWDGKTQKPAKGRVDADTALRFKKKFLDGADKKFNDYKHFLNHAAKHYNILPGEEHETIVQFTQKFTWEQMTALVRHMKGEGDDPRWYAPKEDPKVEHASTDVAGDSVAMDATETVGGDPIDAQGDRIETFGVNLDALAVEAFEGKKYAELNDSQKEKIATALPVVGSLHMSDIKLMAQLVLADNK